jgi:hypothetical protein
MEQEIEKIMVFKAWGEVPACLQRIKEYVPTPGDMVVVLEQQQEAQFIKFRGKSGKEGVLSTTYFRTVRQHQLRERLLRQPRTKAIEAILSRL